jgi:proteic killer suppression protein
VFILTSPQLSVKGGKIKSIQNENSGLQGGGLQLNISLDVDSAPRYYKPMIKTFRSKETERLFDRLPSKHFPANLYRLAWKKLAILDAAEQIGDLRIPPGNHLEKLSGDRQGEYSIRINDQWRICFHWRQGNAYDVQLVDYH